MERRRRRRQLARIARARRRAAVARTKREGHDEEVETALEGLPQAPRQIIARVHLESGVVTIPEVASARERHRLVSLARECSLGRFMARSRTRDEVCAGVC